MPRCASPWPASNFAAPTLACRRGLSTPSDILNLQQNALLRGHHRSESVLGNHPERRESALLSVGTFAQLTAWTAPWLWLNAGRSRRRLRRRWPGVSGGLCLGRPARHVPSHSRRAHRPKTAQLPRWPGLRAAVIVGAVRLSGPTPTRGLVPAPCPRRRLGRRGPSPGRPRLLAGPRTQSPSGRRHTVPG
jgi:hypothetical protein